MKKTTTITSSLFAVAATAGIAMAATLSYAPITDAVASLKADPATTFDPTDGSIIFKDGAGQSLDLGVSDVDVDVFY